MELNPSVHAWAFGIPLWLRGLSTWASVIAGIEVAMVFPKSHRHSADLAVIEAMIIALVSVFLAVKGNELSGKHLLGAGWVFEDDDRTVQHAKTQWSIS